MGFLKPEACMPTELIPMRHSRVAGSVNHNFHAAHPPTHGQFDFKYSTRTAISCSLSDGHLTVL